tara:strand:+ start:117 stop:1004 length:888 start_codon:yes stop_codon:yes gene_type:complete
MQSKPLTNDSIDWIQSLLAFNFNIPILQDQFNIECPFHVDSHASCAINTAKGVWICFAGCGEGSLYGFLKRALELSDEDLQSRLILLTENSRPIIEVEEDIEDLPTITLPENFKNGEYPEWLLDRGFTQDFLDLWQCGKNPYNDFIIPIRYSDGRIVGYASRRLTTLPKYLYNSGFKKSQLLFGADKIKATDYVCITEGPLDAMWLHQNGYQAVALLGIHLSRRQLDLLQQLPTKEFVLCLDNDKAGQIGLDKALKQLRKIAPTTYINIPYPYKDIQDIKDKNILDSLLSNRYTW